MKEIRTVRCPWCDRNFSEVDRKEFWSHVYSEHSQSGEDLIYALAVEVNELRHQLDALREAVTECSPQILSLLKPRLPWMETREERAQERESGNRPESWI